MAHYITRRIFKYQTINYGVKVQIDPGLGY